MLAVRTAREAECDKILEFYYDLIDAMRDLEEKPGWEKNIYPTRQFLQKAIEEQNLWLGVSDEMIVSAMVLNHECADGYENVDWQLEAAREEVAIIHVFGISMFYQSQGIAKWMLENIIEICREREMKAIRLDVLKKNRTAIQLYESMGFVCVNKVKLYYDDTELTDFYLYELVL